MNSLVSTSVSSARVVRVKAAMVPKPRDMIAGIILTNIAGLNQSVPDFIRKGSQPSL